MGRAPATAIGIFHGRRTLDMRIAGLIDEKRSAATQSSRYTLALWTTGFAVLSTFLCGITFEAVNAQPSESRARAARRMQLPRPSNLHSRSPQSRQSKYPGPNKRDPAALQCRRRSNHTTLDNSSGGSTDYEDGGAPILTSLIGRED